MQYQSNLINFVCYLFYVSTAVTAILLIWENVFKIIIILLLEYPSGVEGKSRVRVLRGYGSSKIKRKCRLSGTSLKIVI